MFKRTPNAACISVVVYKHESPLQLIATVQVLPAVTPLQKQL